MTNLDPRDILNVYKSNYAELTYQVVCLTLANKQLAEENTRLRDALLSDPDDDLDTE